MVCQYVPNSTLFCKNCGAPILVETRTAAPIYHDTSGRQISECWVCEMWLSPANLVGNLQGQVVAEDENEQDYNAC
ncbi:MAG TPA: hypothetical protein PK299_10825 [Anaerolineales bacterium]|nr:hypothetical protein [Anaerolineales bacterium]